MGSINLFSCFSSFSFRSQSPRVTYEFYCDSAHCPPTVSADNLLRENLVRESPWVASKPFAATVLHAPSGTSTRFCFQIRFWLRVFPTINAWQALVAPESIKQVRKILPNHSSFHQSCVGEEGTPRISTIYCVLARSLSTGSWRVTAC
jgi:hypothetical protein